MLKLFNYCFKIVPILHIMKHQIYVSIFITLYIISEQASYLNHCVDTYKKPVSKNQNENEGSTFIQCLEVKNNHKILSFTNKANGLSRVIGYFYSCFFGSCLPIGESV